MGGTHNGQASQIVLDSTALAQMQPTVNFLAGSDNASMAVQTNGPMDQLTYNIGSGARTGHLQGATTNDPADHTIVNVESGGTLGAFTGKSSFTDINIADGARMSGQLTIPGTSRGLDFEAGNNFTFTGTRMDVKPSGPVSIVTGNDTHLNQVVFDMQPTLKGSNVHLEFGDRTDGIQNIIIDPAGGGDRTIILGENNVFQSIMRTAVRNSSMEAAA